MPQLDTLALRLAPAHAGLAAKLAALAAFVREHLATFDEAYGAAGRVVTHLDRTVIHADSRRERVDLMGSPARYAEVVPADRVGEEAARPLAGAMGEAYATRHAFDVVVYYGLDSRQRGPEAADTEAFRAMIEGEGTANGATLPGLRVALARQAYLTAPDGTRLSGVELPVQGVRTIALRPVFLTDGGGSTECRHEALLTLTIDG